MFIVLEQNTQLQKYFYFICVLILTCDINCIDNHIYTDGIPT